MEKPMYEILSNDIEMVEDMIDALMIVPKGYKLHPMGNKCALAVDHIHECVYADEEMWINDYEYEIVSEAKEMALPVETDVPDEKLATYADKELYVVIGYDDVCGNGNYCDNCYIGNSKLNSRNWYWNWYNTLNIAEYHSQCRKHPAHSNVICAVVLFMFFCHIL